MKKYIFLLLTLALLVPTVAFGQQVLFPNRGGTGTSTIPTLGQVLSAFSDGTYGPVATSTLGFISLSDLATELLGYVTLSGSQSITGLKTFNTVLPESSINATTSNQLVNFATLSQAVQGLGRTTGAIASSTTNVDISQLNNGDTVNGVTVATGDNVFLKDQSSLPENGVYTVGLNPGDTVRADTMNTAAEITQGATVSVITGSSGTLWLQTEVVSTIGTDNVEFVQLPAASPVTCDSPIGCAGNNISLSGVVPVANGGTNISSYTIGDILYASASGVLSRLAGVATGNALISGGVGAAPSWGKVGIVSHTSGTLTAARGGTGLTSSADDSLLVGNSATTYQSKTLSDCDTSSSALTYDISTNNFGCNSITGGSSNTSGASNAFDLRYTKTLDVSSSTISVTNTTAATTIYSYSVPANTLGTDKGLRLNISGQYLNNSGANRRVTITVSYGGTTMISQATPNIATSANTGNWGLNIYLMAANATNAQRARLDGSFEAGTNADVVINDNGTASVDSTANQTLTVTVANSAAATTITTTKNLAVLEQLNAQENIGGSNWVASTTYNTSVITPTTTVGVWSKGSLFASSTSIFSDVATFLSNVGIGTTSPMSKLSVDGDVAFQGTNFATTTIGSKNSFLKVVDGIFDGSTFPDINVPLLVGETIDSSIGALKSVGINNELIIFEDRTLNGAPTLSFGAADFGDTGNSASISYSTSTPALKVNTNWVIENSDDTPTLQFNTTGGATTSSMFLTDEDSFFHTGATGGYFYDNAIAILGDEGNNLVFGSTNGSIISALSFSTSTDRLSFVQADGGYLFDGNLGIGETPFAPLSRLHITDGDVWIASSTRGLILTSPDDSCWRVTVSDLGALSTNSITCPN